MGPENCCASSGELRKVVEEVAEKAAERAVESVYYRIKADIAEMEKRMTRDITDRVDSRIQDALGMTPQEHIIQHDRMRRTGDFLGGVRDAFWKRVLTAILVGGLAIFGGYSTNWKPLSAERAPDNQAITRDEYSQRGKPTHEAHE